MNQQNNQSYHIEEEMIDLRDLWKTVVEHKTIIFMITAILTTMAIAYSFLAKPVYEAKAVVEIGYIGEMRLVGS